jgi:hypothetical protein
MHAGSELLAAEGTAAAAGAQAAAMSAPATRSVVANRFIGGLRARVKANRSLLSLGLEAAST